MNNTNYIYSDRFAFESPLNKRGRVYMVSSDGDEVLIFTGLIDSVKITETSIILNLVA